MDRQQAQEIFEAAQQAAWISCNPNTSTPNDVENLGIAAMKDLNESIAAGDYLGSAIATGVAIGTHRAMIVRGMDLDALDLFSRLNAALTDVGGNILGTMTYTEYVAGIIEWWESAE